MTTRALGDVPKLGLVLFYWRVNQIGISQRDAAKQMGISHSTLSRIESGKLPDVKTWLKIQTWLL